MTKALKALRRVVSRLLRRLVTSALQRPRDAIERSANRFRASGFIRGLSPAEDSPEEEQGERPREADLPEVVVRADGVLVQHAVAVATPVEIAYNQFTQFEDFPSFMRAIAAVEQVDSTQVDFEFRRWGIRRRWRAQIVDQRPEERIAWRSVGGMRLAGVTTFHAVGDRLTWIDASVVVEPEGALQRIAHRLRLVDLTIARELQRFKAYVEVREQETGAWRGYIADGEVVDEDDYFGWGSASNGGPPPSPEGAAEASDSGAGRTRSSKQTSGSGIRA